MTDNWHIMGGKSNKALDIITSLQFGASTKKSLFGDQSKIDEMELKKEQEAESNRANALAEKVIFEAGLNSQVLELVNQSKKDPRKLPKSFASVPQLATSKMSADRTYNNFMFEEKQRKPSAFVKDSSFNSHYPSRKMSVAPKREYKFGKNYVSHYKKSGVAYQPKRKQQKRPIKAEGFTVFDQNISVEMENQVSPLQFSPQTENNLIDDHPAIEGKIVGVPNPQESSKTTIGISLKGKFLSKLSIKDT